jgi:hypothetical protein
MFQQSNTLIQESQEKAQSSTEGKVNASLQALIFIVLLSTPHLLHKSRLSLHLVTVRNLD